jgi:hypothetical protein
MKMPRPLLVEGLYNDDSFECNEKRATDVGVKQKPWKGVDRTLLKYNA